MNRRELNGGPQGPAGTPAPIDLSAVFKTIRQGKWVILATTVLFVATAILYSTLATPSYEATSIVSIGARATVIPGLENTVDSRPSVTNEIGFMRRSGELAKRVADRLMLAAEALGTSAFYPVLRDDEGNRKSASSAAGSVSRRMKYVADGTDMIKITAESSSPQEAAQLSNFYAEEYKNISLERSRASIVAAREFLEKQLEARQRELEQLERRWETYSRDRDLVTQGESGERTVEEYWSLVSRRDELSMQLRREQLQRDLLVEELAAVEPEIARSGRTATERQIESLNTSLVTLRNEIDQWYINDPTLRGNESRVPYLDSLTTVAGRYEDRLATLQGELLEETSRLPGLGTANEASYAAQTRQRIMEKDMLVRELQADIDVLERSVNDLEGRIERIPRQQVEVDQIDRQRGMIEDWYMSLRSQYQQIKVAEEAELGFVEILTKSRAPSSPVSPDLELNVILSLLLGLFFGVGIAFMRTAVRTRLDTPDDIHGLGYRLLGVVPSMKPELKAQLNGDDVVEVNGRPRSSSLVTLHSPWSPISEHYRLIRTNIQGGKSGTTPKVIMVTSPQPADGKTVTTVNLAVSMVSSGTRTLVVDADLRRPSVHKVLGLEKGSGLGDLLEKKAETISPVESLETDIDNLYCLQAGDVTVPPPELLGSSRMKRLIDQFRFSFDTVIIDTPPVLAVTDSLVLASYVDAAIVVVSARQSTPEAIETTLRALDNVGVPVLGLVFNKFDAARSKEGYYAYQYGYAYTDGDE